MCLVDKQKIKPGFSDKSTFIRTPCAVVEESIFSGHAVVYDYFTKYIIYSRIGQLESNTVANGVLSKFT
jgi:hypothetical protein